jgi:hypothetical protein
MKLISGRPRARAGLALLGCLTLFASLVTAGPSAATFDSGETDWQADLRWCHHSTARLYTGDFNGDGRQDLLCHDGEGHVWVAYAKRGRDLYTGTDWDADLRFCNQKGAKLHIGDFNRDRRDDLLCHDGDGHVWVAYAKSRRDLFTGSDWDADLRWCHRKGEELYIGDFDRDRRDDLLCHDSEDGHKAVAFAKGGRDLFTGTDWEADLGWCYHSSARLYTGDFNGDRRADLLCHDGEGHKWVAYAKRGRDLFTGTDWDADLRWCHHNGAQLYTGDYQGDGRDDLLCHDTGDGHKWVAYAKRGRDLFTGTDWDADLRWCYHPKGRLYSGDYDGDAHDDLLCHDTGNGYKWVIFSDL